MTSKLLPPEYYEKLDKTYQKLILKLENDLNNTLWQDLSLKCKIIDEFSMEYMMPKELWNKRIEMQELGITDEDKKEYIKLKAKALGHFYSKRLCPQKYIDPNRKLLKAKIIYNGGENDETKLLDQNFIEFCLTFPHQNLEKFYKEFEEKSYSPIPKKVIQKYNSSKILYEEIETVKNNDVLWFQKLLESNDQEFIIHNVEYRLGKDLTNKKLWKIYINYLEGDDDRKDMEALKILTKYCRFFLDDNEMKNKLQTKIASSNSPLSNSDPFCDDETTKALISKPVVVFQNELKIPFDLKNCQKSFKENIFNQNLILPATIIRYILENANSYVLQKLYNSCKHFFYYFSKFLCHKFVIRRKPQTQDSSEIFIYKKDSLEIFAETINLKTFKNYYISNNLKIYYTSQNQRNTLSNLINSAFYRCNAKFLSIFGQDLSFKEFKFLVGHGNVKLLDFYDVKIINKGKLISLEEILILTPKIYSIKISNIVCNSRTSEIISNFLFENKFDLFSLNFNSGELEPFGFCNFLKKHTKKDSKIQLRFSNSSLNYIQEFNKILRKNSQHASLFINS